MGVRGFAGVELGCTQKLLDELGALSFRLLVGRNITKKLFRIMGA